MQKAQLILNIGYTTITLVALFVKPIREKIFGLQTISKGVQCLLRSQMLDIYYQHINDKTLKEYERKNFDKLYDAYKSLGGNSFVQDIYAEIREWKTIR